MIELRKIDLSAFKIGKIYLPRVHNKVPILIYHSISGRSDIHNGIFSLDIFKRHLDFLKENRCEVLPLNKVIEVFVNKGKTREYSYPVCLTFDDGYEDFFKNVWPLLRIYNFPAAIFLVGRYIDQQGYLTLHQIKDMLRSGLISIGSHGMEHKYLPEVPLDELDYEIMDSKIAIEDKLGYPVDFFSYPWGGFSPEIQKRVEKAGYKAAFTTNQGFTNFDYRDIYAIKRLTMSGEDGFLRFLVKILGFGYYFSRKVNNYSFSI